MDADIDDSVLMSRYREGDVAAFERLYARHKGPIYRYLLHQCRPRDATADVFQEVWSRVIATRERYEVRATFKTYLYRIAHHCVADHYRQRSRKRADRMDAIDDYGDILATDSHEQPDAQVSQAQLEHSFQRALGGLPAEQREVFLLYEEGGLSLHDIAEIVGIPAETAKSRLRYALAKLRRGLAGEYAQSPLKPARVEP